MLPNVSFIIPTLNAEDYLERCLRAIRLQNYPQNRIEIIVADGGSTDLTRSIATTFGCKIIDNVEILHEPGKTLATKHATGDVLFFTDSDNILEHKEWVNNMIEPFIEEKSVKGFLPQTIPAPDSNTIDKYLGNLFTDPFTWFVYGYAANPKDYEKIYKPIKKTSMYLLYEFPKDNYPLFGLSQGVGIVKSIKRDGIGHADDLLAGIELMQTGGTIAYVPKAGVYHYHVSGWINYIHKYRWRIRNNYNQKIRDMGLRNRIQYLNTTKKIKMVLFIPYALSIIFPIIDSMRLSWKFRSLNMFIHPIATFILALVILQETLAHMIGVNKKLGAYK